ncbi:hypothetical protein M0802_016605 [Mischocyttarus mexicanus]|nr:hypothetical protein M0802_016604 [Mischocyttarus mexicanus]KAI4472658.1 hypothetical protein M0802_016605 [Mischocyttarus mexicanus]
MPLATSDFRNPVCQELRSLRSASGIDRISSIFPIETKTSPLQAPDVSSSTFAKVYNEQGSVDSSDTYASCQTHPSHSQGDLTEETDSNLYINPLEAAEKCGGGRSGGNNNATTTGVGSGSIGSVSSVGIAVGRVKKSISGEVGRNVTDVSPSVESLKDIRPFNEPSKVALNDSIPKHRKIRIQQVSV